MRIKTEMTLLVLCALLAVGAPGVVRAGGCEFDNLLYEVVFPEVSLNFNLGLIVGEWSGGFVVELPLEHDLPGQVIEEFLDQICDPESPDYNEWLCDVLRDFFTDELIDELNQAWNAQVDYILGNLPETALTDQVCWLPWLGGLKLDDAPGFWPTFWDPGNGEFMALPVVVPQFGGGGEGGFCVGASLALTDGQVYRDEGYRADGAFLVEGEMVCATEGIILAVGYGFGGPFDATLIE